MALPEPTLRSAVADERDLFRVPPDFYSRRPDPGGSRLLSRARSRRSCGTHLPATGIPVHGFTGAQVHRFQFMGSRSSGARVPGSQVPSYSGSGVAERSEAVPKATASPSVTVPHSAWEAEDFT